MAFWIWQSSLDQMLRRCRITANPTVEAKLFTEREGKDQQKGGTTTAELCFPHQIFALYFVSFSFLYPNNHQLFASYNIYGGKYFNHHHLLRKKVVLE